MTMIVIHCFFIYKVEIDVKLYFGLEKTSILLVRYNVIRLEGEVLRLVNWENYNQLLHDDKASTTPTNGSMDEDNNSANMQVFIFAYKALIELSDGSVLEYT